MIKLENIHDRLKNALLTTAESRFGKGSLLSFANFLLTSWWFENNFERRAIELYMYSYCFFTLYLYCFFWASICYLCQAFRLFLIDHMSVHNLVCSPVGRSIWFSLWKYKPNFNLAEIGKFIEIAFLQYFWIICVSEITIIQSWGSYIDEP